MTAYYNEFDPFAAAWLEELIKDGLIAPGVVDRRDIQDVIPSDLKEFTQCHFFAGIGVWSLALRLSGWSDDRPIWTGSCPCQPFSAAGKGDGFDDERHLWPAFHWLARCAKPADVPLIGEQVASKDGRAWFDLVSADMEGLGHACGALDTCAAGLGAPFIGQRLYWLAATGCLGSGNGPELGSPSCSDQGGTEQRQWVRSKPVDGFADSRLAPTTSVGSQPLSDDGRGGLLGTLVDPSEVGVTTGEHSASIQQLAHGRSENSNRTPIHPVEYWRDADWLLCRDPDGSRFRPVESGAFPLVDARSVVNRLGQVRGAGNALNVSQAACFVEVVMEYLAS